MSNYGEMYWQKHHWLCVDGSVIEEPNLETTPAGRRVRIAGHSESVGRGELNDLLYQWVYRRARARDTFPVLRLRFSPSNATEEEQAENITVQVGRFKRHDHFEPFKSNSVGGTAGWLFKHPGLPVYAMVKLSVVLSVRPTVETNLHFPNLRPGNEKKLGAYGYRVPILDESTTRFVPPEMKGAYESVLTSNGIQLGERSHPNTKAAMADAMRRYREIDALDTLSVPDLRYLSPAGQGHVGSMTLHLKEELQPESYLHEMQEYAHMLDPADEIRGHLRSIQELLKAQGVAIQAAPAREVMDVLTGSNESLLVKLQALRFEGDVSIDRDHDVSLDLVKGIVFVTCKHRSQDKEKDLLAYEIAKARAELTGETDLLSAFLASIGRHRQQLERMDLIDAARSDA